MDTERKAAKPDSWQTKPMPEQVAVIPFLNRYSLAEMENIRLGLVPEEMEDKWFIFVLNDTLYLHLSWTGQCIYRCQFTAEGENYAVTEVVVNRDPKQHRSRGDHYDALLLAFLIDNLLLGKNMPFPVPPDIALSFPAGAYQHHIAGTGYAEVIVETQEKPRLSTDEQPSVG